MLISDIEARQVAEKHLQLTNPNFFYKFYGIHRDNNTASPISVMFLWSKQPDRFTIDGPIIVEVDPTKACVINRG